MIRTVVIEDEEHSRKMLMGMLQENCQAITVVASADFSDARGHDADPRPGDRLARQHATGAG